MTRHRTDMLALLFGLAFVSVGASFLVSELSETEVDAAWVSAIAFITLGFVALAATFLRHRPDEVVAIDTAAIDTAAIDTAAIDTAAIDTETVTPVTPTGETVQAEPDPPNEVDLP